MPRVQVSGFPAFDAPVGSVLRDVCEAAGVPIESACGGFAACNSCRVRVLEGADALTPLREEEEPFLDAPGQRLACQCEVLGDIRVALEPGL
jgi:ferredoxin